MYDFLKSAAYRQLKTLAEKPIDLPTALTPERIASMRLKAVGFQLCYGTERVDDKVVKALFDLAQEAKAPEKMAAMQKGETVNVFEKRAALHTAMRDQFGSPLEPKAAAMAARELKKLEAFLEKIGNQYTDLVQIGIGGSDLGPRALSIAAQRFYLPGRRLHFISNVDPDDAAQVLQQIDLKKSLFVVVSKSGSTLETLTNEELVREQLKKAGLDPQKHFLAVTGEKSPMDNPARYLASFYMWDFIGGRYSATSMVGAVALAFACGMKGFYEILRGAHEMDLHALTEKNLPLMSALLGIWNRNFLHYPTVAIIPYSQALLRFPAHLQQLDMESNGKHIDKNGRVVSFATGPVIWGEPGTNGQHSFYQLIHQGTDIIPLEFIGFVHSQWNQDAVIEKTTSQQKLTANLIAQSIALAVGQKSGNPNQGFTGNRPNRILLADRLDLFHLGALLAFYEHKVAFQGFIWNINSFDQEGVQLGKKLALKVLNKEPFPLGEAYLKLFP
jgi:glucose-6-phosphate isomerase